MATKYNKFDREDYQKLHTGIRDVRDFLKGMDLKSKNGIRMAEIDRATSLRILSRLDDEAHKLSNGIRPFKSSLGELPQT